MLRKIAAGTSAAVVAAGLAAAPAVASRLPKPGDSCDQRFVFGPPADVPQRLSGHDVCLTEAPPPAPSNDTPVHPPSTIAEAAPPAAEESPDAPGGPGGRRPSGDSSTDDTPTLSPPAVPTGPAPTTAPADLAGPAETARTPKGRPERSSPPPLPATGHDARPLAAAGGVNLVAAGLAFIGGARRRRRRQP